MVMFENEVILQVNMDILPMVYDENMIEIIMVKKIMMMKFM